VAPWIPEWANKGQAHSTTNAEPSERYRHIRTSRIIVALAVFNTVDSWAHVLWSFVDPALMNAHRNQAAWKARVHSVSESRIGQFRIRSTGSYSYYTCRVVSLSCKSMRCSQRKVHDKRGNKNGRRAWMRDFSHASRGLCSLQPPQCPSRFDLIEH
jgi:hypothetical protein